MELLDSYLKAVRRYLPRNQRDDIVAELSVELRSQIESREAELGRRLSDTEQMAIFREQGDPMIVARRYRQNSRSLTIGWELIGPELFPMYLIILACNLSIAVLLTLGVLLYIHEPVRLSALLRPVYIQIGVVTLIFTILNLVRRKSPQPWYYPPAELAPLIPVPRPYSAVGLAIWGIHDLVDAGANVSWPHIRIGIFAPGACALVAPLLSANLAAARDRSRSARAQSGVSAMAWDPGGVPLICERCWLGAAISDDQGLSLCGGKRRSKPALQPPCARVQRQHPLGCVELAMGLPVDQCPGLCLVLPAAPPSAHSPSTERRRTNSRAEWNGLGETRWN